MMWLDDVTAQIEAYTESLGIANAEVDISLHWRAGHGTVHIDAPTSGGGAWAAHDYRIPHSVSHVGLRPIIIRAGKAAADHLLQFVATKH